MLKGVKKENNIIFSVSEYVFVRKYMSEHVSEFGFARKQSSEPLFSQVRVNTNSLSWKNITRHANIAFANFNTTAKPFIFTNKAIA